jgi:hypothetical protein
MQKEMNKNIFKEFLIQTVDEIVGNGVSSNNIVFIINPVKEEGKKLNSKDDFMRLNILSEKNIGGKKLVIDDVVNVLCGLEPLVPFWIDVKLLELLEDKIVFQLDCSMRFRKPSLLKNQETNHAPFRAIQ